MVFEIPLSSPFLLAYKRKFKKSGKNGRRISASACFSAPHVSKTYAAVLKATLP